MTSRYNARTLHLLLDWDGTLTRQDTTHLIAQVSPFYVQQKGSAGPSDEKSAKSTSFDVWDKIVTAYSDDFARHQREYRPETSQRKSIHEEQQWLHSLDPIENRSIKRVEDAGLLKGVTATDLLLGGAAALDNGTIQMRSGWDRLLSGDAKLLTNPTFLWHKKRETFDPIFLRSIISVSWSGDFIKGALRQAGKDSGWFTQRAVSQIEIRANEIDGTTGQMHIKRQPSIRTSSDKLFAMQAALRNERSPYIMTDRFSIYVGDSNTDLECLLSATVGVCIRDDPIGSSQKSLADTLDRLGIRTRHVSDFTDTDNERGMSPDIFWARDLGEVANLVEEVYEAIYRHNNL